MKSALPTQVKKMCEAFAQSYLHHRLLSVYDQFEDELTDSDSALVQMEVTGQGWATRKRRK